MRKLFILLDIDGTLLDPRYQANSTLLKPVIEELQKKGVIFSLNSNRALEDLIPVAKTFSIHGPLVGENGAFFYMQNKEHLLLTPIQKNTVATGLQKIKAEMLSFLKQKADNVFWEDVDTVDALTQQKVFDYPDGTILVLNNKFRKYTMSAHIKLIRDKKAYDAEDEVKELQQHLGSLNIQDVNIDYSPLFWNMLVTLKNVNKRTALDILKERFYNDYEFAAIGDEFGDYLMIKDLGVFYTVANAQPEAKKAAELVASSKYTQGVYDIIKSTLMR